MIEGEGLARQLSRASSGTLVLRAASLGLSFVGTVVVARYIGADGVGIYAWAFAWASVLQLFGVVGFDRLAVREIAGMRASGRWHEMSVFLGTVPVIVLALGTTVSAVGLVAGLLALDAVHAGTFAVAMLLVPVLSLTVVRQATLQGLGEVVKSRLPEDLVRPAAFITILVIGWSVLGLAEDATTAIAAQLASAVLAFVLGAWLLKGALPAATLPLRRSLRSTRRFARQSVPLAATNVAGVLLTQADILLLGVLVQPEVLGVYVIATRLAMLVNLAEFAVNIAFMPVVAAAYAADHMEKIRRGASRVAFAGLAGSVVLAVPLMAFPDLALEAFGSDFSGGDTQVRLLCIAWIVSAAAGQNGTLLTMTHRNRPVLAGLGLALAVNVSFILALVPHLGGDGAALARLIAVTVWNLFLLIEVRRHLGFFATALAARP